MEKTDINSRSGLIVIVIVIIIGTAYITLASQANHNQTISNASNITPAHDNASPGNNTSITNKTSSKNDTHKNSTKSTKIINQTQNTTANSTKVSAQAFTVSNTS